MGSFQPPEEAPNDVYGPLSLSCLDDADGDFHGVLETSTIEQAVPAGYVEYSGRAGG